MATAGWKDVTAADIARMQRKDAPAVKPSKYRNVKTTVDGQTFDSKREADYWIMLRAREKAGEIYALTRQVVFPLRTSCDIAGPDHGTWFEVARYVADFVYYDVGSMAKHVVDAKGKRTAMYSLKKKWLELQSGIVIEEV